MILKVRLDTGGELRVPVSYAHVRDGALLYKHVNPAYEAGAIDLNRIMLVEFEADEPDRPSS